MRLGEPSRRVVFTFLLLNDEPPAIMARGLDEMALTLGWTGDHRCLDLGVHEATLARDEQQTRSYSEAGLSPVEISYGDWSGRSSLIGLQDVIIAEKG